MTTPNAKMMLALEKLFAAEVASGLNPNLPPIAQIGADIAKRLVAEGLAEAVETTLPGHPPVLVRGHVLTLKGHATYCMSCVDEADEDLTEAGDVAP